MKKQILAASALLLASALAGCGGGSSSGTPISGLAAVSGKVADGYLANATVFMDKNGNYQLDSGEPSAMTDANGNYTLMVDPADVGKYPIVAMVTKGVTVDKDTNQTAMSSYLLSMPKNGVTGTASNFISPMSSEVREMMETGKYASVQDAMNALTTKMKGTPGTDLMSDYIAGQNNTVHTAAQNMATLMGSQMTQVFTTSGGVSTVDVNRYRGMMGAIFNNMSSVKGAATQGTMPTLISTMTSYMSGIISGMPYRNMSSAFSGMMGGATFTGGTMTGTTGTTSGGTITGTTGTTNGSGGTMM